MANKKIRWGVLSTAKIGMQKVIPAIQNGKLCEVAAISSRNIERAKEAAEKLGIPKAYGSYEELLKDPDIDAVYIPLPNNLHVPWTINSIKAGKHVLCEKPIGLNAPEAMRLLKTAGDYPELKVMEAFMYRFHPQWQKAKSLVKEGKVGEVKMIHSFFSYYNVDPANIRNRTDVGGGGLMDIGCYCLSFPRFILDKEPVRIMSSMDFDREMKTDRLTSGILDFSSGVTSTFTCSTQLMPFQRAVIFGTDGLIEVEIPVNAPPDLPAKIILSNKSKKEEFVFNPVDQYTLQGDMFAKAVLENTEVPTPLADAVNNMRAIDAVVKSAEINNWVEC